ncbi:MAG: molybdenum cofactor synthesis domain [Actinomycetia bacterium]|nr:molybdenum cofactor synthesis domain [Actinomycetes bacterium]
MTAAPDPSANPTYRAKVLTVSDGVVAGTREDRSGAALVRALTEAGFEVVDHQVSADGIADVGTALRGLTSGFTGVVLTSGGTGFGVRDLTPEGTRAVIDREAPGLAEAIRRASDADGRGFGMLGRGVCGVAGTALVCNLPGSSNGALEGFAVLLPVLPHVLGLLAGERLH